MRYYKTCNITNMCSVLTFMLKTRVITRKMADSASIFALMSYSTPNHHLYESTLTCLGNRASLFASTTNLESGPNSPEFGCKVIIIWSSSFYLFGRPVSV